MDQLWANRAASAEAAIAKRHSEKLWRLPGTQLGVGRLAARQEVPGVRHLALLVAGAPAGLPGRRAAARPAARAQGRPSSARSAAHHWRNTGSLDQRLLRRHGVAGARAGARGQLGGRRAAQGAEEAGRAVPQRVGARGRRRHPVAQAGPVLQRARPTAPRAIFLARHDRLRRAQQMADWIDETLIDPETPSGVRRHQGRLAGAGAVHLLPGRRARARGRTGRPHRGRPPLPRACTGW